MHKLGNDSDFATENNVNNIYSIFKWDFAEAMAKPILSLTDFSCSVLGVTKMEVNWISNFAKLYNSHF